MAFIIRGRASANANILIIHGDSSFFAVFLSVHHDLIAKGHLFWRFDKPSDSTAQTALSFSFIYTMFITGVGPVFPA